MLSINFNTVKDKLKIQHLRCGNIFYMDLDHFNNSRNRCPYCSKNPKLNTNIVKERIRQRSKGEFELVGEYVNAKTPIQVWHKKCNKISTVHADIFMNRQMYCNYCSQSKGEKRISQYLDKYGYRYITEYKFLNLLSEKGNPLRFDFAVFADKLYLIEYDGEFHFKKYFEEQNYEELLIHDEMKNNYAFNNKIPLLRIPYTEFNEIEIKLKGFLPLC